VVMFSFIGTNTTWNNACRRPWRSRQHRKVPRRDGRMDEENGTGAQQGGPDRCEAAAWPNRIDPAAVRGRIHRGSPISTPFTAAMGPDTAHAVLTVDLGAIVANWRLLQAKHASRRDRRRRQANGYGLGAVPVAAALAAAGCRHFFVATPDEA